MVVAQQQEFQQTHTGKTVQSCENLLTPSVVCITLTKSLLERNPLYSRELPYMHMTLTLEGTAELLNNSLVASVEGVVDC